MLVTPNYDVDAPEGAPKSSSAYLSKKDLKWVIAIIVVLGLIGGPLWYAFLEQRNKQVCASNMKGIFEAMLLYSEENDSRLPPLYTVGENGAPMVMDGKPHVWASLLVPYKNARAEFYCPAAEEDEKMPAIGYDGRTRKDFDLTYGMYLPMGAFPHMLAMNSSDTAVLVETSNHGAQETYNPMPFRNAAGQPVPFDAFMAGFDDSNEGLTPDSKFVTRLAFRGASKGYGDEGVLARHGKGIHVFYLDGHKGFMQPPRAEIKNIFPDADGPWRTR
jgi:prepilin-type processing-associated H-X9-DG protein